MIIGYACVTVGVKNTRLSHCILKNATLENLRQIVKHNLSALYNMINYNIENNIGLFRISSDIIPFASRSDSSLRWLEEFNEDLINIGRKIVDAKMRVSMHPGQYTVLNSPDPGVVKNAVLDLEYHAAFLDSLKTDSKHKIILHVGGVYKDKQKAIDAFVKNYSLLSENIKKRLVIENDDKNYNISDVLEISNRTGAPVVFDNLHHKINPPSEQQTEIYWLDRCSKTWNLYDGTQKIHYSQQKNTARVGAHSDTIHIDEFLVFYEMLINSVVSKGNDIDIMLEVKDKNLSAVKCINTALSNVSVKILEKEWARYKYFVLSRSSKLYNDIRQMLKEKQAHIAKDFYQKIEQAQGLEEDKGAEINAAQHVWGYLNKECSVSDKNRYQKLLASYIDGVGNIKTLKNHLLKCSQKQRQEYLINSLYFYI